MTTQPQPILLTRPRTGSPTTKRGDAPLDCQAFCLTRATRLHDR